MPENIEAWWARRQRSKELAVPYAVGTYRAEWAKFPMLVRQYHPDLNREITLTQIPPAADVYLTWQCDTGHLFVATPEEQRSRPGRVRRRSTWCPVCTDLAAPRRIRPTALWPVASPAPAPHASPPPFEPPAPEAPPAPDSSPPPSAPTSSPADIRPGGEPRQAPTPRSGGGERVARPGAAGQPTRSAHTGWSNRSAGGERAGRPAESEPAARPAGWAQTGGPAGGERAGRPAESEPAPRPAGWARPGGPAGSQRASRSAAGGRSSRSARDRQPLRAPGEAFRSSHAPAPASAAEALLRQKLAARLEYDPAPNAVSVARPFHGRFEVWPDIVIPELRVALEYDTVGRFGLEHVGPREDSDRSKDRLLRAAGWEVVRIRCAPLPPLGLHDLVASSTVTDRLITRLLDTLRAVRGDLIVNAYLRP
ncbi:zinc-ribbon domain-containing protein [Herbiconiux sp. CPCC 205763]|uniref:Zinc-ribbon domain-containing protein n=1 Tax=Herbiconiux aconitum TaxID=2970913 RepID=A0ABT2GLP8_9MICO|nr:zinc-ribbon domain-containing protein [Herbiconiux aconitum]MCS5717149.1 zinc-ribbon domain-containing protein [Herbiconiux aconitum]